MAVAAAPGSGEVGGASDAVPVSGDTGSASDVSGATPSIPGSSDLGLPSSDLGSGGGAVASGTPGAPPSNLSSQPALASSFGGIEAGWIVGALIAVALIGAGSRRLLGDVLDRPATTCSLEVRKR